MINHYCVKNKFTCAKQYSFPIFNWCLMRIKLQNIVIIIYTWFNPYSAMNFFIWGKHCSFSHWHRGLREIIFRISKKYKLILTLLIYPLPCHIFFDMNKTMLFPKFELMFRGYKNIVIKKHRYNNLYLA